MIDPKLLRTDPDAVRRSQAARGEDSSVVDDVVAADEARREAIAAHENLRAEQKGLGKRIAKASGDEKAELLSRTKTISGEVADLKKAADEADAKFTELAKTLGNIVIDGVPAGGEDEGVIKETVGTPRDFAAEGFEPKDTSRSVKPSALSIWSAAQRFLDPGSTSSPALALSWNSRCST